jgi:hypothetical protein
VRGGRDAFDNCIGVGQDIVVPESNDSESEALKKLRSPFIVVASVRMLTAIQLDDQTPLDTAEVDDEGKDRMLTTELHSSGSSTP